MQQERLGGGAGRAKVLGRCKERACGELAVKRQFCQGHYDVWYYKNKDLRCGFQSDGGRRMKHDNKVLFLCRKHEVEHLRWTDEIEQTNLARLAAKITPLRGCWIASVPVMGKKGEYVGFLPEGANTAVWAFHRVLWNLLMGGHKPGFELDHMPDDCSTACCNPAHLEPVKRAENEKRKRSATVNQLALENPLVQSFAQQLGLPLPVWAATPKLPNPSASGADITTGVAVAPRMGASPLPYV